MLASMTVTNVLALVVLALLAGASLLLLIKARRNLENAKQKFASAQQILVNVKENLEKAKLNWAEAEKHCAYSERLLREVENVNKHDKGEWANCSSCGRKIPKQALEPDAAGALICAYCSPEAKASGRGHTKLEPHELN